jgi:SAM-dependent methyltransferase
MLRGHLRRPLSLRYPQAFFTDPSTSHPLRNLDDSNATLKLKTAESFGYEWARFSAVRNEWQQSFLGYMRPHDAHFFNGRLMLDVGTGSGRYAHQALRLGARVVAVDLGSAIDVARRNLPLDALTVEADAEDLPFERSTFDLVCSLGVLHHLPDPERAFYSIVPFARPGGHVQIYLYREPSRTAHKRILRLVTAIRYITTRLPHRALHAMCYPLAAILMVCCVLPYRILRNFRHTQRAAEAFPLQSYADHPLTVGYTLCVNDQFDRFSAPLERRYTAAEVEHWLDSAGLEDRRVLPYHGWVGSGSRPLKVK